MELSAGTQGTQGHEYPAWGRWRCSPRAPHVLPGAVPCRGAGARSAHVGQSGRAALPGAVAWCPEVAPVSSSRSSLTLCGNSAWSERGGAAGPGREARGAVLRLGMAGHQEVPAVPGMGGHRLGHHRVGHHRVLQAELEREEGECHGTAALGDRPPPACPPRQVCSIVLLTHHWLMFVQVSCCANFVMDPMY